MYIESWKYGVAFYDGVLSNSDRFTEKGRWNLALGKPIQLDINKQKFNIFD